ncbi:MAG: PKD domain-containing protein [Spirochaetaceae bacterium]|nr:MAG: PKD domain-containing protein [Spirochaetaceae bacterium]
MNCSPALWWAGLVWAMLAALSASGCQQAGAGADRDASAIPGVSANAGGPYAALRQNPIITFDARATDDPYDQIAFYEWDLGDDQTGQGAALEHQYQEEIREYAVTLTVRDVDGLMLDSDATRARIRDRPVASFAVDSSDDLVVGTPVAFDASASHDGDGLGFVEWYRWDFDFERDGDFSLNRLSSEPRISRVFARAGDYTVALIVVDDDGFESGIVTLDILVEDAEGAIVIIE